jgi:Ca2+-binding RTX toxin-like protein
LNGFSGTDRLEGGYGKDVLNGQTNGDRLIGGPGRDYLSGGEATGHDVIEAADNETDRIVCGPGFDTVFFDQGVDRFLQATGRLSKVTAEESSEPIGCENRNPR